MDVNLDVRQNKTLLLLHDLLHDLLVTNDNLAERLRQLAASLTRTEGDTATMQLDPNSTSFPLRKDLPSIPGAPQDAAWFWGKDDQIGRLNLLTPTRVKNAAGEIKTGEMARMDLPLK